MKKNISRWPAFAAVLMFAGATFQITSERYILGALLFCAAGCFASIANICRKKEKKNKYIAYCGLNCETCEARTATVNNDDALREKVAKHWSELNGVEITPEMINCTGCRIEGAKTPYCESLCPIRQCAQERKVDTCGSCKNVKTCDKVGMILDNNEEAKRNLGL